MEKINKEEQVRLMSDAVAEKLSSKGYEVNNRMKGDIENRVSEYGNAVSKGIVPAEDVVSLLTEIMSGYGDIANSLQETERNIELTTILNPFGVSGDGGLSTIPHIEEAEGHFGEAYLKAREDANMVGIEKPENGL